MQTNICVGVGVMFGVEHQRVWSVGHRHTPNLIGDFASLVNLEKV